MNFPLRTALVTHQNFWKDVFSLLVSRDFLLILSLISSVIHCLLRSILFSLYFYGFCIFFYSWFLVLFHYGMIWDKELSFLLFVYWDLAYTWWFDQLWRKFYAFMRKLLPPYILSGMVCLSVGPIQYFSS